MYILNVNKRYIHFVILLMHTPYNAILPWVYITVQCIYMGWIYIYIYGYLAVVLGTGVLFVSQDN